MPTNVTAYQNPRDGRSKLAKIGECWIQVGSFPFPVGENGRYYLTALPDLSWSKGANYNEQPIIGRTAPIFTYSNSKSKTVSITLHMHCPTRADLQYNLAAVHYLASALHPRYEKTYAPPPICKMKCGNGSGTIKSVFNEFRFILRDMKQSMNPDSVWDPDLLVSRSWDLELTGDVLYTYQELPGAKNVIDGNW